MLAAACIATASFAAAAEPDVREARADDDLEVYVGVNPAAAFYGLTEGTGAYVYPFFSGHEYGLAVSGGVRLAGAHRLELRLAIGSPNTVSQSTQLHVGYLFHVLDHFEVQDLGLYAGVFARFTASSQQAARDHYYSFVPYLALGYWLQLSRFYIDFRLEQTFFAVTVSDAPHTGVGVAPMFSPLPGLSPVLPAFVCNVGVVL